MATTYDYAELQSQIKRIASSVNVAAHLYAAQPSLGRAQGDVVYFPSPVPVISETGDVVVDVDADYWLVLGNTCDLDRSEASAAWTQVAPLMSVPPSTEIAPDARVALTSYQTARRFYLPRWKSSLSHDYVADFTRSVTIHKQVLHGVAGVEATLTYGGWALLHSCLVRYLARADRRNVP